MFRLFQIDPETSAIHVNTGAFLRHKHGTVFMACLDAFRQNKLFALWQTLWRLPDSEERAFAALFTSQLVHELRHYIDLVLTPYGFYRLRSGFEFYQIAPLLLARAHEKMILPLSSGLDPFFQQELDVPGYSTTFAHVIAKIAASRAEIVAAENRPHKREAGLFIELGGDAILEALAFGYQVDLLQHPRFNTPALRRLMPYAYESAEEVEDPQLKKEITQFDLRYRWHYALLKILPHREVVWVILADFDRCLLLLLPLWACGQRFFSVVHMPTAMNWVSVVRPARLGGGRERTCSSVRQFRNLAAL